MYGQNWSLGTDLTLNWVTSMDGIRFELQSCGICLIDVLRATGFARTGKVMTCQTSGRAPRHTFGSIEVVETGRRRKEEGSKKTARVLGVQMCFSYVSATLWVRTIVDQLDWNNEKPQTHCRFLQLYNSLPLALGEAEGCRIPRLQGFKELEAWPHATYAGQCNPKNLWWLMGPCAVLGSGSHIQRSQADRGPKAGYFFGEARWSPSLTDFSNDPSVCLEPSWAYFACLAGVSRNFLRPTGFGSLGLVRWE